MKTDNGVSTLGSLRVNDLEFVPLEDTHRDKKVYGKTRIPAGEYEITLRTFGGHHERYLKKFPFHRGMLWLHNVPKFKDILIHIGNYAKDTDGCILVGLEAKGFDMIVSSTLAYEVFYREVLKAFDKNEKVTIKITDNCINPE